MTVFSARTGKAGQRSFGPHRFQEISPQRLFMPAEGHRSAEHDAIGINGVRQCSRRPRPGIARFPAPARAQIRTCFGGLSQQQRRDRFFAIQQGKRELVRA